MLNETQDKLGKIVEEVTGSTENDGKVGQKAVPARPGKEPSAKPTIGI